MAPPAQLQTILKQEEEPRQEDKPEFSVFQPLSMRPVPGCYPATTITREQLGIQARGESTMAGVSGVGGRGVGAVSKPSPAGTTQVPLAAPRGWYHLHFRSVNKAVEASKVPQHEGPAFGKHRPGPDSIPLSASGAHSLPKPSTPISGHRHDFHSLPRRPQPAAACKVYALTSVASSSRDSLAAPSLHF